MATDFISSLKKIEEFKLVTGSGYAFSQRNAIMFMELTFVNVCRVENSAEMPRRPADQQRRRGSR